MGLTGGTQGLVGRREGLVVLGLAIEVVVVGSGLGVVAGRAVVVIAWVVTGGPENTKPYCIFTLTVANNSYIHWRHRAC